jgi:hypothetical protein
VAGNGTGVVSVNGAAVILNNSTVQTNGTGLNATSGGAIFSYGNNPINGNQPGGRAGRRSRSSPTGRCQVAVART